MKKIILALLVIFIVAGTVACARGEPPKDTGAGYTIAPATSILPPVVSEGIIVQSPAPAITLAPAGSQAETAPPVVYTSSDELVSADRLIIRTGRMVLVVEDVAAAIEQITAIAATYNGYVVVSNSWQNRDRMMGNIAIRVEVAYFEPAMSDLANLAVEVRSESTSGEDVTEEYVDLEAKLRNLEASEAQLLELMKQAGDVSEILEVQRELVKTRDEIERTQGRMQYLEQSAAMSYIAVDLEQSKLGVEFSADTRNAKEGQDIRFIPTISGGFAPYSYAWDFGDGSTSTEPTPSYAYSDDGNYSVTLVVTDDRGNIESYEREDYITVTPGWSAGSIASGAWKGLSAFFRALGSVFIWLGIFSPVWIIILLILYFAWWRHRRKA